MTAILAVGSSLIAMLPLGLDLATYVMSITFNNSINYKTQAANQTQIMQNQTRAGMVFKMRINSLSGNTIPNETGFLNKNIFDFWHYFNGSSNSVANTEFTFGANLRVGTKPLAVGVVYAVGLSFDGVAGRQTLYINAIPSSLGTFVGATDNRIDSMVLGLGKAGPIINYTLDDIFIWNGYTPTAADMSTIVSGTDPATIGLTASKRFRWTLNGVTGATPTIGDLGLKNSLGNGINTSLGGDGSDFLTVTHINGTALYAAPLVWTASVDIDNAYVSTSGKVVVSFFKSLLTGLSTSPNGVFNVPHLVVNGTDRGPLEKPWFSGYYPYVFYATPGNLQIQTSDTVALTAPAGWANTPVGGAAALNARLIDNRTSRSPVGADTIPRTLKMGLNNAQYPYAAGALGMYAPLKNMKFRCGWVPGNRGKFNASGGLLVSDMKGNNGIDTTGNPGIAGLWLVMWDDLDHTKTPDSFTMMTGQPTYTSVTERVDLRSNGVNGIGRCHVYNFANIPGQGTASIHVGMTYTQGTNGVINYANYWLVPPGEFDIVNGAVSLDRSDQFALARRYLDRVGPNVSCLRWVDSSICGGNPVSFPYPEPRPKATDESWGDTSHLVHSFGFTSIGPIDAVATPWMYSPRYGKPGYLGSTFPATLATAITTAPPVGTRENYTFSDAVAANLMAGLEIQLNSEICRILLVSGTTVSLYRGSNGTTPAPHAPGVYQVYGRLPTTTFIHSGLATNNGYTYQFTTQVPHGFTSGNPFAISGSGYPSITWSDGEVTTGTGVLLVRWVFVLGPNIIATVWGPSSTGRGATPVQTYTLNPAAQSSINSIGGGMPIERTCDITSRFLSSDIHLNLPMDGCDDFMWEYARIVLAKFPAGRKIFLELANEPWNWRFTGFGYFSDAWSHFHGGAATFVLQYYAMRAGECWAIFDSVFTDAGRGDEIYGLFNCQMGTADASNYLTYCANNGIKAGAIANAPYLDLQATSLNLTMAGVYDDDQMVDMFTHDFFYNPNTYIAAVKVAQDAINTYNTATGNTCLLVGYEGGVERIFPVVNGATVPRREAREHDCCYNPNFYHAEQAFYVWLQKYGFQHLTIYNFALVWAPESWGMYHGFQQDHGMGDGSDGKFDNRTLMANSTSPHYKGTFVNQDASVVSVRGQAYLDWNASTTIVSAHLGCAAVVRAVPPSQQRQGSGQLAARATLAGRSLGALRAAGATVSSTASLVAGPAHSLLATLSSAGQTNLGMPIVLTVSFTSLVGVPLTDVVGEVHFFEGSVDLGSVAVDNTGVVTWPLLNMPAGAHSLFARYTGGNYFPFTTPTIIHTVLYVTYVTIRRKLIGLS